MMGVMNARLSESYGDRYYNHTLATVESAKNCIGCGECETKCPYQLPIIETIAANIEWFHAQEPCRLKSSTASGLLHRNFAPAQGFAEEPIMDAKFWTPHPGTTSDLHESLR